MSQVNEPNPISDYHKGAERQLTNFPPDFGFATSIFLQMAIRSLSTRVRDLSDIAVLYLSRL